jgi:hypothetical protein
LFECKNESGGQYTYFFAKVLRVKLIWSIEVAQGSRADLTLETLESPDFEKDLAKPAPNSSDEFLKGFIANDDNFMPYQAVRKDGDIPDGH